MSYQLQLLHANDLEGSRSAIENAPNFATIVDTLEDGFANTILISSGDNFIPGPFSTIGGRAEMTPALTAAYTRFLVEVEGLSGPFPQFDSIEAGVGRIDIAMMNIMQFDASALGNHEFDGGPDLLAELLRVSGGDTISWPGTSFPYLSANLDFSNEPALADLFTSAIRVSDSYDESLADLIGEGPFPAIAPATIIEEGGERIGVIGATTQLIEQITSNGSVEETTGNVNNMATLATVIQPLIDAMSADGINKIIVASHLQSISLEMELAGLLSGVDIIIAGGSNTLQADAQDRLRPGDTAALTYPFQTVDAQGNPVMIVGTDGDYTYVGRLVVEFDENGLLVPASVDSTVSGVFATDDAGVVAAVGTVTGALSVETSEAQEVGSVTDTAATGRFDMFVDGNVLVVRGSFESLSAPLLDVSADGVDPEGNPIDGIHLHNGAAGTNGPVVRALDVNDNGDGSGNYAGRFLLSDAELAELNAGNFYVNIHTTANGSGELRGQLPGAAGLGQVAADADVLRGLSVKADIIGGLIDSAEAIFDTLTAPQGANAVYLEGSRAAVRTEETNLGNLTADANLDAARKVDDTVLVSIKNGGGIRDSIGTTDPVTGRTGPGDEVITTEEIQNSLRFDNKLALVTVSSAGLIQILEHAVASTEGGSTPGQFAQIGGLRFAFSANGTAQVLAREGGEAVLDPTTGLAQVETAGSRIQTVALADPATGDDIVIYRDGALTAEAPAEVRMVTLSFLAAGGDGYPFAVLARDVSYLTSDGGETEDSTADNLLGEQQALTEYLNATYPDADAAFADAETDVFNDRRIINLDFNRDLITLDEGDASIVIDHVGQLRSGSGAGGSEVVAARGGIGYVTNGAEGRIDVFDVSSQSLIRSVDLSFIADFDGVQSVAVSDDLIAAAVAREASDGSAMTGVVALFALDGTPVGNVEVGNLPDMLTFTPDGTRILVAGEGEPRDDGDPLGTVSVIDLSNGPENASATVLDFTAFDGQEAALSAAGVLLQPGIPVSQDLEPEYIAVLPGGTTAWVGLQEANAYAVLDLTANTITGIRSFGLVDRSLDGFEIDASNADNAINLQNYSNLFGMRQPDAITALEIGGETYVFTANEGDARDATEARIRSLDLDPDAFPDAEELQRNENLGRLNVRTDLGDTDGDGDYDQLYHYGARSFTVYDTDGNVVFDSGSQFAHLVAEIKPDRFNQNQLSNEFDSRSDDKGVEPEAIAIGEVAGRPLLFVGLERDNGIMVFDVTNPAAPEFVSYVDSTLQGNAGPETIQFIPALESSTGRDQIIVAYEIDGNTAVYDVRALIEPETGVGDAGDNLLAGGSGDDTLSGGAGNDTLRGNDGFDWLLPGSDADVVDGGTGFDVVSYADSADAVQVNLATGLAFSLSGGIAQPGQSDVLISIEGVTGTRNDDLLLDSAGDNGFRGLAGADTIILRSGGSDTVDGGTGVDLVSFDGAASGVSVSLLRGRTFEALAERDFLFNVENLFGSRHGDTLTGDARDNLLGGLGGDDFLMGNAGNDIINGGAGSDTAQFGFARDQYVISGDSARAVVEYVGPGAGDGTDILLDVEFVRFADGELIGL